MPPRHRQLSERQRREGVIDTDFNPELLHRTKQDDEAKNESLKREAVDKAKLQKLVQQSNRIIAQCSAIFPFDLFPTTIVVEDSRITVIFRSFFSVAEQHTVDIKDVTNVFVGNGPIFGSLVIVSRTFIQNSLRINKLWKKDAVRIRNAIESLRTIARQQIDTTNIEKKELVENIQKISKTAVTI